MNFDPCSFIRFLRRLITALTRFNRASPNSCELDVSPDEVLPAPRGLAGSGGSHISVSDNQSLEGQHMILIRQVHLINHDENSFESEGSTDIEFLEVMLKDEST